MNELRVGGAVEKFYRLRQHQQEWRRCKQHRVGHGDDGADRAAIVRLPVWIVIGRRLLPLCRLTSRDRRSKANYERSVWLLRQAGWNRRRGPRDSMEMPERQRKLDGQRQQREPSSMLDIRSEPLHADMHPASERPARKRLTRPMLYYNIRDIRSLSTAPRSCVQRFRQACVILQRRSPILIQSETRRTFRTRFFYAASTSRTPINDPRAARSRQTRRAAATNRSGRRTPATRRHP
jgi:hypothetical protein